MDDVNSSFFHALKDYNLQDFDSADKRLMAVIAALELLKAQALGGGGNQFSPSSVDSWADGIQEALESYGEAE